jgi:hypothetical protein
LAVTLKVAIRCNASPAVSPIPPADRVMTTVLFAPAAQLTTPASAATHPVGVAAATNVSGAAPNAAAQAGSAQFNLTTTLPWRVAGTGVAVVVVEDVFEIVTLIVFV